MKYERHKLAIYQISIRRTASAQMVGQNDFNSRVRVFQCGYFISRSVEMKEKIHFEKDNQPLCRQRYDFLYCYEISWMKKTVKESEVTCKRCLKLIEKNER